MLIFQNLLLDYLATWVLVWYGTVCYGNLHSILPKECLTLQSKPQSFGISSMSFVIKTPSIQLDPEAERQKKHGGVLLDLDGKVSNGVCYFDTFAVTDRIFSILKQLLTLEVYTLSCSIGAHSVWEHMGVYNPATGVSETFVTKGYFASFLLFEILLTFILISLFSFHFFFFQICQCLFWLVWIFCFL